MTEDNENADVRPNEPSSTSRRTELPSEWRDEPVDPDLEENLEYDLSQWEKISVVDDSDRVIFLPESEEQLKDDAFIVSAKSSVCDLASRR